MFSVGDFDDFHFNSDADIRGGERRFAIRHGRILPVVAISHDIYPIYIFFPEAR